MSGKRNNARENLVRRLDTIRKNEGKVLLGYMKTKYPGAYGEAVKYMRTLRAKYPDKKDLTKTEGFWDMMNTGPAAENTRVTSKVVSMDTFRLQIKLDEYGETANPPTQDLPAEAPSRASWDGVARTNTQVEQVTAATAQDAIVSVVDEGTAQGPQDEGTAQGPQDANLNLLDDATLTELINDLREDPTISDFFSQMEYEFDNCPLW